MQINSFSFDFSEEEGKAQKKQEKGNKVDKIEIKEMTTQNREKQISKTNKESKQKKADQRNSSLQKQQLPLKNIPQSLPQNISQQLSQNQFIPKTGKITVHTPIKMGSGINSYEVYGVQITSSNHIVQHRYSNFDWLRERLCEKYPGCLIPPIPEKINKTLNYLTSDQDSFLKQRQQGLERFLNDCREHKILGNTEEFLNFVQKSLQEFEVAKQMYNQEASKNNQNQN